MTNLTVISHSCVLPENQRVWAEVARHPEINLTLIAPARWNSSLHGPVEFRALPQLQDRSVPVRVYWPGQLHLHTYSDLGPALTGNVPDVLYLDEDPHSLVAAQALSIQAIMDYRLIITLKQNVLKRHCFPFSFVEKRTHRLACRGAATSQECLEVARAKGFARPAEIIGYPIDTDIFHPGRPSGPSERLRIGYSGRLVPEKGVADLIEAVSIVQRSLPVTLSIVGDGPEANRLARQAAEQLQPNSYAFWDCLAPKNMPEWYQALDVLILPSLTTARWKEQFGRVLGEAMACGAAVVGSDSGFIPEFIETTGGGLVYEEGDIEGLAAVIVNLAQDPALRQKLAATGREGVIREYGLPAVAERIARLVLSV